MEEFIKYSGPQRVIRPRTRYKKALRTPRYTIVIQYDKKTIKVGVSRCSGMDNFEKKEGLKIARKRIEDGQLLLSIGSDTCDHELLHVISSFAFEMTYITGKLVNYVESKS